MKMMKFVLVGLLGLLMLPKTVMALSLSEAQLAALNAVHTGERVDQNDSVALNIRYVGSQASAHIAIRSDSIIAYAPAGTMDTSFGSDGVGGSYDTSAAAYDTMGELCDVIEALDDYECTLVGAKRDDDSSLLEYLMNDSAATTSASGLAGLNIKFDTGTTEDPAIPAWSYSMRVGITPASGKRVILKQCVENSNGTGNIYVYGELRKLENNTDGVTRNDTTLVWDSGATVDDTDKTLTWADASKGGLEFGKDEHVVISAGNGTDFQASGNFLECYWEER